MVILFLANGFEEIEALGTVDILRRANVEIKTVSISEEKGVVGSHGISVTADLAVSELKNIEPQAVILPGGLPGADYLEESKEVRAALADCASRGGLIAAICAAPKVLGAAGLLSGKCATCYPGFEAKLSGAVCKTDRVVVDGNLITSRGPGTMQDFAFAILEWFGKDSAALRKGMLYDA